MKIISIWNNKGGAAKTTTTFHIAQGLALMGKTVMVIDNDQQLSLSQGCLNISPKDSGLAQIYRGEKKIEDVAQVVNDISIGGENTLVAVPGNKELGGIMEDLATGQSRLENLGEALESEAIQSTIDYVLIDNNPFFKGPSEYSIKICDEIFIPCPPSKTDFEGLVRTIGYLKTMGEGNLKKFTRLIPSIVKRTVVAKDYLRLMKENFPDQIVENFVSESADVPKAIDDGKVVYLTRYTSKYAQKMLDLIGELFPEIDYKKARNYIQDAIHQKKVRRLFENIEKSKDSPLTVIKENYTGTMPEEVGVHHE